MVFDTNSGMAFFGNNIIYTDSGKMFRKWELVQPKLSERVMDGAKHIAWLYSSDEYIVCLIFILKAFFMQCIKHICAINHAYLFVYIFP